MMNLRFKKTFLFSILCTFISLFLYQAQNYEVKKYFSLIYKESKNDLDFAMKVNTEISLMHKKYWQNDNAKNEVYDLKFRLIHYILNGAGLCAHRALLFMSVMHEYSIPSRKLLIGITDNITHHVIAEAFIDGKWLVFDPLFGYSYNKTKNEIAQDKSILLNIVLNDRNPHPWKYPIKEYHFDETSYFNWNKTSITMKLKSLLGKSNERFIPPYYVYRPFFLLGFIFFIITCVTFFLKKKNDFS